MGLDGRVALVTGASSGIGAATAAVFADLGAHVAIGYHLNQKAAEDVRAKIISLSLWVSKYSRRVTREKAPIDPLIKINRTIMQGLQG